MDLIEQLAAVVGDKHVLTGADTSAYREDWTKNYPSNPVAVVRPASATEISAILKIAAELEVAVVPASGRTGLSGGAQANGELMLSLERLNKIREIRPAAQIAIVEAGVVLSQVHDAADEHDLVFPLTFGAKGSAMIGGVLSTNAGGSNVVRYGNTRSLCLGLEVVMADGRILDLMSELHKDNTGFDLRDLFIGAEGTLGIITAAVLRLLPKPAAYATAMVAVPGLPEALRLLNHMQVTTGGAVEAFEYMPRRYLEAHARTFPQARAPFAETYDTNIMIEIGATSPREADTTEDGSVPVVRHLEEALGDLLEDGAILDAVVAQNEAQRREMWERREQAAEVTFQRLPLLNCDVAVPIDRVGAFIERMDTQLGELDPDAESGYVAHLGDGNVHYTIFPSTRDPERHDQMIEKVEDVALSLGGTFSAEHGIGVSKRRSMARRKNAVALDVMRAIKTALDPTGLLNPGKVLPD